MSEVKHVRPALLNELAPMMEVLTDVDVEDEQNFVERAGDLFREMVSPSDCKSANDFCRRYLAFAQRLVGEEIKRSNAELERTRREARTQRMRIQRLAAFA